MEYAFGGQSIPLWCGVIAYAERFHVEPHKVDPPGRWWVRLSMWDRIRAARRAREYVDEHTADKSPQDIRTLYNWLVLEKIRVDRM